MVSLFRLICVALAGPLADLSVLCAALPLVLLLAPEVEQQVPLAGLEVLDRPLPQHLDVVVHAVVVLARLWPGQRHTRIVSSGE